jgi:hypothetical protein
MPIQEGCIGTEILHTDTFKRGLGEFRFFHFQESKEIERHAGEFQFTSPLAASSNTTTPAP